ncbi:integral membrane protein [Fusarium langsethiae]|uniref:Integral membrane protein n=1 Tax=Fusarium langsethiae TaxID=179993 RepID=A0A0M9ELZ9_FUSLA|nr:integral membrane protein [Fusarium langsethiae]GKU08026.1 unnamed protein product [Fusarium langsethiae]
MVQASTSIVADLTLLTTSSHAILGLQSSTKKKLVGFVKLATFQSTLVATAVRLGILIRKGQTPDTTFNSTPEMLCFIIEANLAIICGSLDMFMQLGMYAKNKIAEKQSALMKGSANPAQGSSPWESVVNTNNIQMWPMGSGSLVLACHRSDEELVKW